MGRVALAVFLTRSDWGWYDASRNCINFCLRGFAFTQVDESWMMRKGWKVFDAAYAEAQRLRLPVLTIQFANDTKFSRQVAITAVAPAVVTSLFLGVAAARGADATAVSRFPPRKSRGARELVHPAGAGYSLLFLF